MRGGRHVSRQAEYLICVGMGGSDSRHKADSPFHAITKASRILDALAVLMMSINKGINELHHNYPILEALQEHLCDRVMEKMVSSAEAQLPAPK